MKTSELLLKYKLLYSSSNEPEQVSTIHNINWISARYPNYPQYLFIQFNYPVHVKKVKLLIHENKIPTKVDLYTHFPKTNVEFNNTDLSQMSFQHVGYITMDDNIRSGYNARELKTINVNFFSYNIKFEVHKNYYNTINIFNQVGIIKIEFFGEVIQTANSYKQPGVLGDSEEEFEKFLEELCGEKLNYLKEMLIKTQNDEANQKKINQLINTIRDIAKHIFMLELEKQQAVEQEDFYKAKSLKEEIIKAKNTIFKMDIEIKLPKIEEQKEEEEDEKGEEKKKENDDDGDDAHSDKQEQNNIDEHKVTNEGEITENIQNDNDDESLYELSEESKKNLNANQTSGNLVEFSVSSCSNTQNKFNPISNEYNSKYESYDDLIVPALKNKIKAESNLINGNNVKSSPNLNDNNPLSSANIDNTANTTETDTITETTLFRFSTLIPVIGQECLNKALSKHLPTKEESFPVLREKIPTYIREGIKDSDSKTFYIQLFQLISILLEENNSNVVAFALDLLYDIFNCIKLSNNSSFSFKNDIILNIVMNKLGDINNKIRKSSLNLYKNLFQQSFVSYSELFNKLIETDLNKAKNKFANFPVKLTESKLILIQEQLENVDSGKVNKELINARTLSEFIMLHILNPKTEIQKYSKQVFKLYIKIFDYKSIQKKIEALDKRLARRIMSDVPEFSDYVAKLNEIKEDNKVSVGTGGGVSGTNLNQKNRSKSNEKSPKRKKSPEKPKKVDNKCQFCLLVVNNKEQHKLQDCVMFCKCMACHVIVEIRRLNYHLLYECANKRNFKQCKKCKESILIDNYDKHVKDDKCIAAKPLAKANRCPLCHNDIPSGDKGFYSHLVTFGCKSNVRRFKK